RKRGCVAFRKSVTAETFELLEGLLGEVLLVAVGDHAGDELVAESRDSPGKLEGRHALAELISLAGREAGADYGDLHRLLLEERHAERLAEHLLQFGLRIDDWLQPFAATQIGMHHVALDWAWPHDRDLDYQVVEGPGLDPRQHRHLRAAL